MYVTAGGKRERERESTFSYDRRRDRVFVFVECVGDGVSERAISREFMLPCSA